MADISYTPTTWADGAEGGTPIDAAKLNNIESGIVDAVAAIGPNDTTEDGTLKAQIDAINSRTSPNASYTSINDNLSYRIKNGICFVRLSGRTSSQITNSGLIIGVMPEGARTNDRFVIPFSYDSFGNTGQVVFDTNGNITAYCGVAVSAIYTIVSYPV